MKTLKQVMRVAVFSGLLVLGLGMVKEARASGNPDTMTITVTPGNVTYAVTISSPYASGYNFGTVNVGLTTVSTQAIGVQNSGNVSAYFALAVADVTGGGLAWTNGAAAGNVTYAMQGLFQSGQPVEATFVGAANRLAATVTTGQNKYGQASTKTLPTASQNLWLNLLMPTGVADAGAHTLILYVNGQAS